MSLIPSQPATFAGGCFIAVWLLFWCTFTLCFDAFLVYGGVRQLLTLNYASAPGQVVESEVITSHDSEGTSYRVRIKYSYALDGKEFTSENRRYLDAGGSFGGANQLVAAFPRGKPVTVYYNQSNPADAVLSRGLELMDCFLWIFITPFNVIGFGGCYFMFGSRWRRYWGRPPLGVQVRDDGLETQMKVYSVTPLAAALVALLGVSFACIFAVGFGMVIAPLEVLIPLALAIVLGTTAWAYIAGSRPHCIVTLEAASGQISCQAAAAEPPHSYAISDVQSVELVTSCNTDDEGAVSSNYQPTIKFRNRTGGDENAVSLVSWTDKESAQWVVDWLRERLKK